MNRVIVLDELTAIITAPELHTQQEREEMAALLAQISPSWTFVILPWDAELTDLRGDPTTALLARELADRMAKHEPGLKLVSSDGS